MNSYVSNQLPSAWAEIDLSAIAHNVRIRFRKAADAAKATGSVTVRGLCDEMGGRDVLLIDGEIVERHKE